jgi:hypothetical protein
MKAAFIAAFALNLLLLLVGYFALPDTVAMRFSLDGTPDSWASKEVNMLLMLAFEVPLFFLLLYAPTLVFRVPRWLVNLPHKDYWLSEERKAVTQAKMTTHIYEFGIALYFFLACAGGLTLQANLSEPVQLDEKTLLLALGVFLVFTVYWIVKFYRVFRPPRDKTET